MITLYHSPQSRSSRIIWLLEELAEPFEIEYVTVRRPDGSGGADPRNVHPDKKVPALDHDGTRVSESAAICLYLTDRFPAAQLGPPPGDPRRAAYLTWLFYYAGVAEPTLMAKVRGLTETGPNEKLAYDQLESRLRTALDPGPYLLGDAFSAADILFVSAFQWAPQLMPKGAYVDAYLGRIAKRPALARAQAKDAGPAGESESASAS